MQWQNYTSGTERLVYRHPHQKRLLKVSKETKENDPESEYRETLSQLMARFYLTKTLHLLYPTFIPNVYCVAETTALLDLEGTRTVEISQAVEETDDETILRDFFTNFNTLSLKDKLRLVFLVGKKWRKIKEHPNYQVARVLGKMGVILDFNSVQNFIFSPENKLYYVDRLMVHTPLFLKSQMPLQSLIKASEKSTRDVDRAQALLNRAVVKVLS
jgi:hypothetical protein